MWILCIHLLGHQTNGMEHLLADRLNLIFWQCESDLANVILEIKVLHMTHDAFDASNLVVVDVWIQLYGVRDVDSLQ